MSLAQEYELLRRVPFFAEIEPAKLKLLAFMSERVGFDDGKLLCRQGDPGDAAYLIIEGEVENRGRHIFNLQVEYSDWPALVKRSERTF